MYLEPDDFQYVLIPQSSAASLPSDPSLSSLCPRILLPEVILFLRTPDALGGKRRLLRKTSNLFLSKCEPGKEDPGDLKISTFEDEWQPEIAIWPPKPEISISLELRQIASKFQRQIIDFHPFQAR